MNKKIFRIALRAVVSTALCVSLISYPHLIGPSSSAAIAPAIDIKSESQYRSEAALYDRAIRDIASIASMKLDTADQLKQAIAILDRARPNLVLIASKLITIAFTDSTLSAAVKKRAPDKSAAELFLKEVSADQKAVLKLDGAQTLSKRIQSAISNDAEILKRAAAQLKEGADKVKRSSPRGAATDIRERNKFKAVRVGFSPATEPATMPADPGTIIATIIFVAVVVILVSFVIVTGVKNINTPDGQAALNACLDSAETRRLSCDGDADRLVFLFLVIPAKALCRGEWLLDVADCYYRASGGV